MSAPIKSSARRDFQVVFVTCRSVKQAERISGSLLNKRLIACANIMPGVKSRYRWKGKLESAPETMMLLKARGADFKKIEREIKRLHSYEVPEIISLPIVSGSKEYLDWIEASTN